MKWLEAAGIVGFGIVFAMASMVIAPLLVMAKAFIMAQSTIENDHGLR